MNKSSKIMKLSEVVGSNGLFTDGDWVESKDQDPYGDVRLVQLADIGDGSFMNKSNRSLTKAKSKELNCTYLQIGDVLVSRMPDPIGRACIFPGDTKTCATVVDVSIIRPDIQEVYAPFLTYQINSRMFRGKIWNYVSGATRKRISRKNLGNIEVSVPPLNEQKQIVQILDTADTLRQKRKEQLNLLDDYLKSVFFEMFGDPVINDKGWNQRNLSDVGEIQGGLQVTTKRQINPIEVPYLRVANVYRDRLDLNEIKVIKVTKAELQRTKLCSGDILIVEGHGNRTEIGRTSVWDGSIDPCVHQNHLIRIRINMNVALPIFISNYLNSDGGRRQLFSMGKTTSGLNTISASNVKALKVILPPIELQKKYKFILNSIQQTKQKMRASLKEMDNHFNALMQRYFG